MKPRNNAIHTYLSIHICSRLLRVYRCFDTIIRARVQRYAFEEKRREREREVEGHSVWLRKLSERDQKVYQNRGVSGGTKWCEIKKETKKGKKGRREKSKRDKKGGKKEGRKEGRREGEGRKENKGEEEVGLERSERASKRGRLEGICGMAEVAGAVVIKSK